MGDKLHIFSFKTGFKRARKNAGYTQKTFSEKFGISIETVKNWEQGRNVPEIETIEKLCGFFDCDIDYLFNTIDCRNHDLQFIHQYTGLSEVAIKQLHHFTTYRQGKVRLAIIDYFLQDAKFSFGLIDNINEYYSRYDYFSIGKEQYFRESEQLNNLAGDNLIKMIELQESGKFVQSVNKHELTERKNAKDAAQFRIIKLFDDILENLVEYFYQKNNRKE